jgi:leucyl aminopeptidase
MTTFLTKFSSFHTRYYQSQTGRESQLWLLGHLKEVSPRSHVGGTGTDEDSGDSS